jgi:hypothetical protein
VRHAGPHQTVDGDGTAIGELDSGVLQAITLGSGREADGLQDLVSLEHLALSPTGWRDRHLDQVRRIVDGFDLRRGEDGHAEPLERPRQLGGNLRILKRDQPLEILHDGDGDPVVGHHVAEFDPDRSGTRDDDRLGQGIREDLLLVRHHPIAQRGAGQQPSRGTRGNDHVIESDGALAIAAGDAHGVVVGEGRPPVDFGDLVLPHQEVNTLDHPF